MADVTKKRVGELQRGVFKILLDETEGLSAREVISRMASVVPPTEFERQEYPNSPGHIRFDKMIRFATVGCVKAGWLVKDKSGWYLTDSGRAAYHKFKSPEDFNREIYKLYKVWRRDNPRVEDDIKLEQQIVQAKADITAETAEEQAWADLMERVRKLDPYDVQNVLVPGLLKGMGYHVSWLAPPGADGGVDIIAHPDALGIKKPTIKVSVRRRETKADVSDLRQFISRLHGDDVGIYFSVSGFTREAEKETRSDTRQLRLMDLERFFGLWVEYYKGIPDESRKLLAIRPVWFLTDNEVE